MTIKIKKPVESHFTLLPTRLLDYILFRMKFDEIKYSEHTLILTNILLLLFFFIILKTFFKKRY